MIEIVEIDYRAFMARDSVPGAVEADLGRCDTLWLSYPQIPKNSSVGMMQWGWGWREWRWTGGPSIPRQAIFEESVLVHADQLEGLQDKAEAAISAALQAKPRGVTFALFLRVAEKYVQGISPGEKGFYANLRRSYVLLGKRQV